MKIISLNIWNGRLYSELENFFVKYASEVDVFCLQEIFSAHNTTITDDFLDTPEKVKRLLGSDYSYISDGNGLMICFKKDYEIKSHSVLKVFEQGNFTKNILSVLLTKNGVDYLIATIHGIWSKEGRKDTPERLKQSEIIKDLFDKYKTKKILTGDFNLLPTTESVIMLEQGMVNLIKKCSILSTRTSFKKQTNLDKETENFADYIFVSPDIEVKTFKVIFEEVSDHYPLMLEI